MMVEFLGNIFSPTLTVPTWEIITLLGIVSVCMLTRATRLGILITYVFTLHMTFRFLGNFLEKASLMILGVLGAIVLILGLISLMTED